MKVLDNKSNMFILEDNDYIYLFSYNSPIAKVCNTIETDPTKKNNYGLYFTINWDYSQTTLKQLYNFIELYSTQKDNTGNTFAYKLDQVNNKKEYLKKQLELGYIKMIKEEEF